MGTITSVSMGIAKVSGLPGVGFDELVQFPGGLFGIAFDIDPDEIGVVLLGECQNLHAGDQVERTGRVMDVPVGDGLIGRVIDAMGRPVDGKGPVASSQRLPIERPAPPIMDRAPVSVPLETGIIVIDALIPIGRGQRELIVGDRQTGKSAIAIDTILNQRDQNVVCVYCAIGQRASSVAKVIANLTENGAMDYTVVVVTAGNDAAGSRLHRTVRRDQHRRAFHGSGPRCAHRLRRPDPPCPCLSRAFVALAPAAGREAFPGDIFYIHSRLLERATLLSKDLKGGSLTALPIIETEAQNISAYIPTNLISITDGQIYLSPTLFELGVLPAVDVGRSVSRVGGKAQRAAYRAVAGDLKLAYAQFSELESFAKFGTRLDEHTRKIIDHGQRIRAIFIQPELEPASVPEQIVILMALTGGVLDSVPIDKMRDAEQALRKTVAEIPDDVRKRFSSDAKMTDEDRKLILQVVGKAIAPFQPKPAAEPRKKP